MRSRALPFEALPGRTSREQRQVRVGSYLFLFCAEVLGCLAALGGWGTLENPADPGREPFPSFFRSEPVSFLRTTYCYSLVTMHQCMYGVLTKKPTMLLSNDPAVAASAQLCTHSEKHGALIGRGADGGFRTAPAAEYPPLLSRWLAECLVQALVRSRDAGRAFPFEAGPAWQPPRGRGGFPLGGLAGGEPALVHRGAGPLPFQL